MRIAIYTRVSTQEQALNGHSIDEQEERTKKYCDAMNWQVYKVYRDGGFSGGNTDRPALQAMIKDIEKGRIDKVLVYKLDRLSRSQLDTLYLIEKVFLVNNTDFVSMSENFDTSTPFGRAMIGILAVFAQLEREQIKERMMIGKEARAKEGKFHGSATVPIGYDYINGELVVNEFEKMQINKAYEMYASGMGIQKICDYLNNAGLTHKHGKWWALTLRNILGKKTYLGYSFYGGKWYKGTHEPIVEKELFDRVAELKEQKHTEYLEHNRRDGMATSYLGGFIYCANCGAKYVKDSHQCQKKGVPYKKHVYKCHSRAQKSKNAVIDPNCRNKIWNMDELNNLIFDEIKKLALDPDYINELTGDSIEDNSQPIKAEIEKLENQISKVMDLYTVGNMPIEVLQDKIHELNDRKIKLEHELESEQTRIKEKMSHDVAMRHIQSFSDILATGDLASIRAVVGALIDKIVVDNDDVTIYWNFT